MVYLAQCLFFGLESFRFFAARISEAKKIRWTVHRMPFATGGSRARNRERKTREVIRVGTCTEDLLTREVMNASRVGRGGRFSVGIVAGGVEGGVGRPFWGAGSSHLITNDACFARCWIM